MNDKKDPKKLFDDGGYIEGVGRRKTAVARVRIFSSDKNECIVNEKDFKDYFLRDSLEKDINDLFTHIPMQMKVTVLVKGGGFSSQADAVKLGLSRAASFYDKGIRTTLKSLDYLKRDARIKERKKPGLKKARKAPQWSKR